MNFKKKFKCEHCPIITNTLNKIDIVILMCIETTTKCMVIMIFLLQDGVTPLIAASCNGHVDALKLLIANKADVNLTDKVYIVYLHMLKCMPNYLEVHMAMQ